MQVTAQSTRLSGRRLVLGRLISMGVLLSVFGMFIISLPTRRAALADIFENLVPAQYVALHQIGVLAVIDASVSFGLELSVTTAFLATAAVILWRRSDDWLALHVAAALAGYIAWVSPSLQSVAETTSPWQLPARIAQAVGMSSTVAFLWVYPDGQFVPVFMRVLMVPLAVSSLGWLLAPHSIFDLSDPFHLSFASFGLLMGWWATGLVAQSYRYAHVATVRQRQQMIPILGAAFVGISLYLALEASRFAISDFQDATGLGIVLDLVGVPLFLLTLLLIPLAFAIAIFRFRLWEIELLINRALVYGALTAIVAGLYPTSLGFFQRLFIVLSGDHSEAAVVASTLLVASLLTPLKSWLQAVVDNYMKQSPDELRTLQSFADRVRDVVEVLDVEALTRQTLDRAVAALHATGGAIYLERDGHFQLSQVSGEWHQVEGMASWLETRGVRYGWIALGPAQDGKPYTSEQQRIFAESAALVARALHSTQESRVTATHSQSTERSLA